MASRKNNGSDDAGNVTPEAVQEITRELVTSRRAIAEAQGAHRAVMKRAKGLGINTKAIAEVVNNRALDADEVTRHYRDVMRYAAINGATYALQQDLFPTSGMDLHVTDTATAEHQEWEASEAGYLAGNNGQPAEGCPFPPASSLAQMWLQSWHRGQAAIAATLEPGETAPVARGRSRRVNRPPVEDPGATATV
jgi:ribosome modulation factor/uncharacterized protein (UPF0335 family)